MTKRAVIHVENTENLVEFAEFLISDGWTILSANKTEEILRKQKIPVTKENALSENNMFMADTSRLIRRVMMTKYHEEDEPYISHPDDDDNNIFIICMNVLPSINPAIVSKQFDNQLCPKNFFVTTVLRNAFRNYENLIILTDPEDYKEAMIQLRTGSISMEFRTYLAAKALNLVSAFDAGLSASILQSPQYNKPFMNYMMLPFKRELQLHSGMNPQQSAYLYKSPAEEGSVGNFLKYQNKDLTYTLVNDIAYAWRQINTLFALLKDQLTVKSTNSDGYEFTTQFTPLTGTVFSLAVKFGTILGASHATNVLDSFKATFTYDSISTTDTVFACSAVINTEAAEEILKGNFAAIVAPGFTSEAKQILSQNKKTKLIPSSKITNIDLEARFINGGVLVQTKDSQLFNHWSVRTKNRPSQVQTDEMVFGMLLAMGARSYSAILLKQNSICGIAQGCTSAKRAIDGVWYEALKCTERANGFPGDDFKVNKDIDKSNLGEVLVCDAAIPFTEGLKMLIDSGVKAILQTGGTSTDDEFIEYCNEHGVVMVFTGMTHLSF
jgi:phosphoribosylaminoimidazolecarboxamide formyltransferase/IMP cyclohydrolase